MLDTGFLNQSKQNDLFLSHINITTDRFQLHFSTSASQLPLHFIANNRKFFFFIHDLHVQVCIELTRYRL